MSRDLSLGDIGTIHNLFLPFLIWIFLMAALSLRSLDYRRQYPADPRETGSAFHGAGVAGYHSRCPSGKFKTILFI
jgi:hypothetical protein